MHTRNEEVMLRKPYVSTFNLNNTELFGIFKNNMHILTNDQTMREALSTSKIIKNKRQPPNLKRLITKAKFTVQKMKTFNKVFKCNRPIVPFANALKRVTVTLSMVKLLRKRNDVLRCKECYICH